MAAMTYPALKTELTTDPASQGYAAKVAASDYQGLADMLNLVQAGITVRRPDISAMELLEAVDTRDLPSVTAGNQASLSWFESALQARTLRLKNDDGSNTRVLANLNRILGDTQGSQTRLAAIANRTGSRAEALWGAGTLITATDVARALTEF